MSSKRVQFTPRGMELTYDGGGTSEVTYADLPSGSGTWAATPTISGVLTLTAGQIVFPATQNASTNANTLDDYKEGPWTPIDASGAGLSLTVTTAYYVKVGQQMHAYFDITYPATANGSQAQLGGLPIAAQAGAAAGGFIYYSTCAKTFAFNIQSATTKGYAYTVSGGSITNVDLSGITLRGVFIYRAGT